MSTQGMVEADKWKALLREIDDTLCEIISGAQGAYEPDHGSKRFAESALKRLREAYPVEQMWWDTGIHPEQKQ